MSSYEDGDRFEIPSVGTDDEDLTAQLFRSAFRPPGGPNGTTHRWRDMEPHQTEGAWQGLASWVRWFVATYKLTTSVVPECWWRHSEIVAELYALQRAELASYTPDDTGFGPLAFHERLPHAVERLRTHCRSAGCVGLQAHKEPVLRVLRIDEQAFLEWQRDHHQLETDF